MKRGSVVINKLSETGMYHKVNNEENQDALYSGENRRFTVITLADGVSECKDAKTGAEIAVKSLTELFLKKGEYFINFDKKQIAEFAVSHINYELRKKAESEKKNVEDYSSTVASVLLDRKSERLLYFSIGDSVIIASESGKCKIISNPSDSSQGCCVTTTKGAETMAKTNIINVSGLDSVIICSDGAWKGIFKRNKLKEEVKELIKDNNYSELNKFIKYQDSFDDSSFISMVFKKL